MSPTVVRCVLRIALVLVTALQALSARTCAGCERSALASTGNPAGELWVYAGVPADNDGKCWPPVACPMADQCHWEGNITFINNSGAPRAIYVMGVLVAVVLNGANWNAALGPFSFDCGAGGNFEARSDATTITSTFRFQCVGCSRVGGGG